MDLLPTEITAHALAYQIIGQGVPIFFVQDEFARAVVETDLPHDFTLEDLHWPRPGMVLGFPARFMSDYLGRETCYVYAANCDAAHYRLPQDRDCPIVTILQGKVGWQYYSWLNGRLESFVTSFFRGERLDEVIARNRYTDFTGIKDQAGIEADRVAADRVSALMLKLLVILNTRPSLVEFGTRARPARCKHGRIKQRELWSPNVIGWKYRHIPQAGSDGSHASPRMHFRRGHIRNQPHGPNRTERRLIWIQPMLIGGPEA